MAASHKTADCWCDLSLIPPWVYVALVNSETLLLDPRVMAALDARYDTTAGAAGRKMHPGRWYGADPTSAQVTGLTASVSFAVPLNVYEPAVLDTIAIEVVNANAAAVIRLAIYGNTEADMPDTPILETAPLSAATTGIKQEAIDIELEAGVYWLVAVAQGGTVNTRGTTLNPLSPVAAVTFTATDSATAGPASYTMPGVTGALPVWAGTETSSKGPRIMVRVAT